MSYPADWKSIAAGPRQLNRGRGAGHSPFQRRYTRLPCTQWRNQILELGEFPATHNMCVCVSLVAKVSITTGLRQSISLWWATEGCSDGSGWVRRDGGVMEKVQRRRREKKETSCIITTCQWESNIRWIPARRRVGDTTTSLLRSNRF
jgi:hypothetical protein